MNVEFNYIHIRIRCRQSLISEGKYLMTKIMALYIHTNVLYWQQFIHNVITKLVSLKMLILLTTG